VPFARTDEYGLSLSAVIASAAGSSYGLELLAADVFVSMEGLGDEKLTFTHSFQWEQKDSVNFLDTTKLELDWATRPAGGLPIPFLSQEIGKTAFLSHVESAEAIIRYEEAGAFHPITLVFEHSTSIVMPKNGSIKAQARVGYDLENLLAGSFASRIGFTLGLEAKLSF
jgi:hypothetical protein